MSTFTQNVERFICSLCGFEFSEEKYLRNHFKHCQDIENPADRLGAGIVKNEDCTTELEQRNAFDEIVTSGETFDIKVEDVISTEYTVSGFKCNASDPPMEQLEELRDYNDCGYQAESTELEEHTKIYKTHIRRRAVRKQHKSNSCDVSSRNLLPRKTLWRKNTENKLFKCSRCDYSSIMRANFTTHTRIHTGETPYKCTICDYASVQASNLKAHMRKHTGQKPFKCTVCDFAFARKHHVNSHMKSHTGEKPFKCTLCDYVSAHACNLKLHMSKHSGENLLKCTLCDYASVQASDLKVHMKIHTRKKNI